MKDALSIVIEAVTDDKQTEFIANTLVDTIERMSRQEVNAFCLEIKALTHHRDTTVGLWATDRPELVQDPQNMLFQISYEQIEVAPEPEVADIEGVPGYDIPIGTPVKFFTKVEYSVKGKKEKTVWAIAGDVGKLVGYNKGGEPMIKTDRWPEPFEAMHEHEFVEVTSIVKEITFRDCGQDFLMWKVNKNGKVVDCYPHQYEVWSKWTVTNFKDLKVGAHVELVKDGAPLIINYPITEVKEL